MLTVLTRFTYCGSLLRMAAAGELGLGCLIKLKFAFEYKQIHVKRIEKNQNRLLQAAKIS